MMKTLWVISGKKHRGLWSCWVQSICDTIELHCQTSRAIRPGVYVRPQQMWLVSVSYVRLLWIFWYKTLINHDEFLEGRASCQVQDRNIFLANHAPAAHSRIKMMSNTTSLASVYKNQSIRARTRMNNSCMRNLGAFKQPASSTELFNCKMTRKVVGICRSNPRVLLFHVWWVKTRAAESQSQCTSFMLRYQVQVLKRVYPHSCATDTFSRARTHHPRNAMQLSTDDWPSIKAIEHIGRVCSNRFWPQGIIKGRKACEESIETPWKTTGNCTNSWNYHYIVGTLMHIIAH